MMEHPRVLYLLKCTRRFAFWLRIRQSDNAFFLSKKVESEWVSICFMGPPHHSSMQKSVFPLRQLLTPISPYGGNLATVCRTMLADRSIGNATTWYKLSGVGWPSWTTLLSMYKIPTDRIALF